MKSILKLITLCALIIANEISALQPFPVYGDEKERLEEVKEYDRATRKWLNFDAFTHFISQEIVSIGSISVGDPNDQYKIKLSDFKPTESWKITDPLDMVHTSGYWAFSTEYPDKVDLYFYNFEIWIHWKIHVDVTGKFKIESFEKADRRNLIDG